MRSFREYIQVNEQTVYRGVTGKYSHDYARGQSIMWVSTSEDHSQMYTSGDGELLTFELNTSRLKPLDLGFRSSETPVNFDEIQSRFKQALMGLFKDKKISRDKAMDIIDGLDKIDGTGHRPVWEWVQVPEMVKLIKQAGFNAIRQNEGITAHAGNVVTYGILDQKIINPS